MRTFLSGVSERSGILVCTTAIIALLGIYTVYFFSTHYIITGATGAMRVAEIAIQKNDPSICSKIKMFLSIGVSEKQMIEYCHKEVLRGMSSNGKKFGF